MPPSALISKGLPYPPALSKNSKSPDDKKRNLLNNSALNNTIGPLNTSIKIQKNLAATSPPPPPPPSILNHLHQQQQQQQKPQPLNQSLPNTKPASK